MKTRYLIAVCAVLLAVVGMTIAQPQPKPKLLLTTVPQPTIPAAGVPPTPPQPDLPPSVPRSVPAPTPDPLVGLTPAPRQQTAEAKPESLTIEQLIDAVDGFRDQKAELEKKEKAYLKVLHRKAEKLKDRIDGLGGDTPTLPPTFVPQQSVPGPSNSIPPAIGGPIVPTGPN